MANARDGAVPALDIARRILDAQGFRPRTLSVVSRAWASGTIGSGSPVDTTLVTVTPTPKSRILTRRDTAADIGTVREGDWRVWQITMATVVPFGGVTASAAAGGPPAGTGGVSVASSVLPSGVTQGDWALVVNITGTGGIGVGAFRYSTDGGATFSAPAAIPATFQVPGIGVLVTFTGSFVSGDSYAARGTSRGYTSAQLAPTTTDDATEILYRLGSEWCTRVRADFDRNFGTTLYLRNTRLSP